MENSQKRKKAVIVLLVLPLVLLLQYALLVGSYIFVNIPYYLIGDFSNLIIPLFSFFVTLLGIVCGITAIIRITNSKGETAKDRIRIFVLGMAEWLIAIVCVVIVVTIVIGLSKWT